MMAFPASDYRDHRPKLKDIYKQERGSMWNIDDFPRPHYWKVQGYRHIFDTKEEAIAFVKARQK